MGRGCPQALTHRLVPTFFFCSYFRTEQAARRGIGHQLDRSRGNLAVAEPTDEGVVAPVVTRVTLPARFETSFM